MEKVRTLLRNRGLMLTSLLRRGGVPFLIAGIILLLGLSGVAVAAETGTFSSSTSATPTPSVANASPANGPIAGYPAAGGGDNVVQVINHADGHFRMDGKVKLNRIPGPNAGPKNEAFAYSSCTDCQTMAVALEINLISPSARNIQPLNEAVALNYKCTACVTYARAIQYDIQVADPTQVPPDVRELMRQMDATMNHIKTSGETFAQAFAEVNAVISEFKGLAVYLTDKEDTATAPMTPGASPMPSDAPSPSATATATASGSPTTSPSPSATPSSSP
ncbi:MAG TPA: hypothetical protein VF990_08060 [Candidatus Dormibacteraeota bacterium]